MKRTSPEDDVRIPLQLSAARQAQIAPAAVLRHMSATQFITEAALREAVAVIAQPEAVSVSVRDFARIVELLKHPPTPNTRLRTAVAALPDWL